MSAVSGDLAAAERVVAEPVVADWIAVDWGTTRLRAWAMADETPLAAASGDRGMAGLRPDEFEPELLKLVEPWLSGGATLIVACGMVGSRQGWAEAPYLATPAAPHGGGLFISAPTADRRLDVRIAPGLSQAAPTDVMRGEETQIAGLFAEAPDFDGVVCLPGTHSKWARLSAGEVVGFRTYMTGELYALAAERSVLRHSIGAGWDEDAFAAGVAAGIAKPEALAARLFSIRAEDLLQGLPHGVAAARLSGLLIGAELAAAKGWWLGMNVAIVGAGKLAARYAAALSAQGAATTVFEVEATTIAGLCAAKRALAAAAG